MPVNFNTRMLKPLRVIHTMRFVTMRFVPLRAS
jgi:hypothetical protein